MLKYPPPNSLMYVPINVPNFESSYQAGMVECSDTDVLSDKLLRLIPGLVEAGHNQGGITIVNDTENSVVLQKGEEIGKCTPAIEVDSGSHQCRMMRTESSNEPVDGVPDHLVELIERSSTHLSAVEIEQFTALLKRFENVFAKSSDDLGQTDRVRHKIDTNNARPIRQSPRRQPFGKRDIEKQELDKMLSRGIVEPSTSAWASPIVLITKKDGSTRFCVDYRKLNDVTVKDGYPIPRVIDCLDSLSGNKWFNCMDLNSGFWQIALDPSDKEKTGFCTSYGLYQFTVMPFGLANAPSTFERLMEDVLRGLHWNESLVYMDDIITPGVSVDQCLKRLENVFKRLRDNGLKLKPSKCIFFQKSVTFLGHVVSETGVHTDPIKITAVKEWPTPQSVKQVRSFLGLASYYRKFVKGFADIARPLNRLCEKYSKFKWTDECQIAFDKLKNALVTLPVLVYPKLGSRFVLDTDASDQAVGAVLSQEHDGKEHVVAYMSKSLNKHEQKYCITRKELLAVVSALKHFHTYLYDQEILLRTDNEQ